MLERARAETHDKAITYEQGDLETFAIAPRAFDLIYSSLTFHYLRDLRGLVERVHAGLAAGGRLMFSAEHPLYTEPGPDYLDEGPRTTDWLTKGVVKQHRTLATYLNRLIEAGFVLRRVEEWGPAREQIAAHPEWKVDNRRPYFLLVSADR